MGYHQQLDLADAPSKTRWLTGVKLSYLELFTYSTCQRFNDSDYR